eukprot:5085872-Prymnesium_polylepis.1
MQKVKLHLVVVEVFGMWTRGGRIRTQRRRSRAVICAWMYLFYCKNVFFRPHSHGPSHLSPGWLVASWLARALQPARLIREPRVRPQAHDPHVLPDWVVPRRGCAVHAARGGDGRHADGLAARRPRCDEGGDGQGAPPSRDGHYGRDGRLADVALQKVRAWPPPSSQIAQTSS